MPRYKLSAMVTVSAYCEVEAETADEARQIAEGFEVVIGGIGTGADPTESWVIEDADGVPQEIQVGGEGEADEDSEMDEDD